MTDKIEVGEYVRTRKGTIDIVRKYDDKLKFYWCQNGLNIDIRNQIATHLEDVVNHSKNIIDLIQVGDYVNGSQVVDIVEDMQTGELHLEMTYNYTNEEKGDCTIYNKDIKSILTKEQFENNCYKVVK